MNGFHSDCSRPHERDSEYGMVKKVLGMIALIVMFSAPILVPTMQLAGSENAEILTAGISNNNKIPNCHPHTDEGSGSNRTGHLSQMACCGIACMLDGIPDSGLPAKIYPSMDWAELLQVQPAGNIFGPTTPPPNSVG